MTIVAILQARMSSTRLPGKVLAPILQRPMIEHQIERIRRARSLDRLVVATTVNAEDDAIADNAIRLGVECFRGSLHDVLDRYYNAACHYAADTVIRLTGDCPLADWQVIDSVVRLHLEGGFDYTSNSVNRTFPRGLDVEAIKFNALEAAWQEARLPSEREHVTPFIWRQPKRFCIGQFVQDINLSDYRWTVDEPVDLEFARAVYEALYSKKSAFTSADIIDLLDARPAIAEINASVAPDTGTIRSAKEDRQYLRQLPVSRK